MNLSLMLRDATAIPQRSILSMVINCRDRTDSPSMFVHKGGRRTGNLQAALTASYR